MRKMLLIQPGRFGDILICLPIARFYSCEFEIDWFCPERFHPIFNQIDYCKPVKEYNLANYDEILDLSFGIIMGTEVENWWQKNRDFLFSFVEGKYILSGVPLEERWKLVWNRNVKKEIELYKYICNKNKKTEYCLVHEKSEGRFELNIKINNKVLFEPIEGYSIWDWYLVIRNAKSIHCIDSVLCNFVEVVADFRQMKYYYDKKDDPQWNKTIIRNNWRIVK